MIQPSRPEMLTASKVSSAIQKNPWSLGTHNRRLLVIALRQLGVYNAGHKSFEEIRSELRALGQ